MSVNATTDSWTPEPLPRGPHKLPAEAVRASQRGRLLRAMLELVGANGYHATTVPQVVAAAKVSRNAFYDQFSDKADCFLAACDEAGQEILDQLVAFVAEDQWLTALRRGMATYLRWWQDRPVFARAYFVEFPSVGPRAATERDRQYARFRAMFSGLAQWARAEQPDLPMLSAVALDAAVFVPTEMVARRARTDRLDTLVELEEDLIHLIVRLLADDTTAMRAASHATPAP